MKTFHGGCHGCTMQTKEGLLYCAGCQYFDADWELPDLNDKHEKETWCKRQIKKLKPLIDFSEGDGSEFIKKIYDENGVKLSTLEKEIIKHLKIIEYKDMKTKDELIARRDKLNKRIENFKEETKLEVGKWYNYSGCLFNYTKTEDKVIKGYGFIRGEYRNSVNMGYGIIDKTPATDKEVKDAYTKQAKKLGLLEKGVVIKNHQGTFTIEGNEEIMTSSLHDGIWLKGGNLGGVWICIKGVWASIIEDNKPKIGGYEMKFVGNEIKFGCETFTISRVKALYKNMRVLGINSFNMSGSSPNKIYSFTITIEQLKEVVDYLNK